MAATATPAPGASRRPARRWTPWRIAGAVVLAALVAMWVYAFSGLARRESPLRVADRRWAAAADEACAPAADAIAALPPAVTASTPQERAALLRQGNAEVAGLIDRLDAVAPPADAEDARMVARWVDDWRTYLADREAYTERLAAGADERFVVTPVDDVPITEQMDEFARYNELEACETPADA